VQQRKDELDHIRFLIQIKSATLDRTNQDEIGEMNKLLNKYEAIINPKAAKETKDSVQDNKKKLKALQKMGPMTVKFGDTVTEDFEKNLSSGKPKKKKYKNLGKI
tara:strand:+ start:137 stop:451 length:315 start_codon:yes stop_codon:yes gene_type:complete